MIELLLDSPPFAFPVPCVSGGSLLSSSPARDPLAALRVIAPRPPAPQVDNFQPDPACARRAL